MKFLCQRKYIFVGEDTCVLDPQVDEIHTHLPCDTLPVANVGAGHFKCILFITIFVGAARLALTQATRWGCSVTYAAGQGKKVTKKVNVCTFGMQNFVTTKCLGVGGALAARQQICGMSDRSISWSVVLLTCSLKGSVIHEKLRQSC